MEVVKTHYCRFCAELKNRDKLIDIEENEKMCEDVAMKLAFVNALYVDVSNCDGLPKTICLVCYNSLNKAYDFLESVRQAQDILFALINSRTDNESGMPKHPKTEDENKQYLSDDDNISGFDDFLPNETHDNNVNTKLNDAETIMSAADLINLKAEPKEELDDQLSLRDTLNVHDIIDAALKVPITSNVTLYAKEVSGIGKETSWKTYPWLCSICKMGFLSVDSLRSHSKMIHGKCFAFKCVDCKFSTRRKGNFNSYIRHVRKHRKSLRKYCFYCDNCFDSASMRVHIKQHFTKSSLPCPRCGEIFKNEDLLQAHLREFNVGQKRTVRRKPGTPLTIEDLTCDICKKIYKNPNSLRDHRKQIHTTERKRDYTCDRCGKTYYNKGTLTSHIMSHDKIRPHVCRICNRSFLFPNMLRRHVNMHTGVKPYSCDQCGRSFRLKYQLNAHKIIHTDIMPYVCQYCSKAFRFKQILKNHELQHTGNKPYSCQHCGMEFTNWSNYNKHMKRRHGIDTSKKKITPEGTFPIHPVTGQIIRGDDDLTEEWRNKIMIPGKRGKKKAIKTEEKS